MTSIEIAQLTVRVSRLVEATCAGTRVEDAVVELKADWPDPRQAARQLAAQANAARSEDILWILGLKETVGVRPLTPREPAAWYAQVVSAFEKPAPRLLRDLEVPTPSGAVRALVFATDEAPYLIEAEPSEGLRRPELLWREGTGVRHARRTDLLSVLLPHTRLPEVEVLSCTLFAYDRVATEINLMLQVDLYVLPRSDTRVVFPFHRLVGELRRDGLCADFSEVELARPAMATKLPHLVEGDSEIVLTGPSKVLLTAQGNLPVARLRESDNLMAGFRMFVAGQELPVVISVPLTFAPTAQYSFRYILEGKPWE